MAFVLLKFYVWESTEDLFRKTQRGNDRVSKHPLERIPDYTRNCDRGGCTMNKKQMVEQDAAKTYNEFKVFEGKKYTGMKVGGRHKWYYDNGELE
jgi:hypothetical protein